MDVNSILEHLPTAAEWYGLTHRVKKWMLYTLVCYDCRTTQSIQRKPYTAVQVGYAAGTDDDLYFGDGFSKVVYPDKFCKHRGAQLAHKRAVLHIVKQLLHEEAGYGLLTSKWDRYQQALQVVKDAIVAAEAAAAVVTAYKAGDTQSWEEIKYDLQVDQETTGVFENKVDTDRQPEEVVADQEAELGPYADFTIKHPALDDLPAVVPDSTPDVKDEEPEPDDEGLGTLLVHTSDPYVQMR